LLATKIFDMAVNMGSKQAWKIAQRALAVCGCILIVDGIVGPQTIKCMNDLEKRDYDVLVAIRELQKKFYEGIMLRNPKLQVFALGWFRRAVF
jgi:lysozyme family protein